MYMMSRAHSSHLLDLSPIFQCKVRSLKWFALGVFLSWTVQVGSSKTNSNYEKTYELHRNVAVNEHMHALLKTVRYHCDTRKLNIKDI